MKPIDFKMDGVVVNDPALTKAGVDITKTIITTLESQFDAAIERALMNAESRIPPKDELMRRGSIVMQGHDRWFTWDSVRVAEQTLLESTYTTSVLNCAQDDDPRMVVMRLPKSKVPGATKKISAIDKMRDLLSRDAGYAPRLVEFEFAEALYHEFNDRLTSPPDMRFDGLKDFAQAAIMLAGTEPHHRNAGGFRNACEQIARVAREGEPQHETIIRILSRVISGDHRK